jgi:hypothetical protein
MYSRAQVNLLQEKTGKPGQRLVRVTNMNVLNQSIDVFQGPGEPTAGEDREAWPKAGQGYQHECTVPIC